MEDTSNKEAENSSTVVVDSNPDSYLNRGEFSSEIFKIELKNLPKNFGFGVRGIFLD